MRKLDLWQKFEYTAMRPGLERINEFLVDLGNPEKCYKTVHIAGTNGKGSTAAMVAKVLEAAGYKTGLYISPHLVSMTERISVNSREINSRILYGLGKKYYRLAKKHSLTFFEFITALAFIYFKKKNIDVAVLETGLGGRFDATNVIDCPDLTVITGIAFDHTEILGSTISRIAMEKAGIIKRGTPCVCGSTDKSAIKVIERKARASGCDLWMINKDFSIKSLGTNWNKQRQNLLYSDKYGSFEIELPLLGDYQIKNAGIAVAALRIISKRGLKISDKAIKRGIRKVQWHGRFDVRKIHSGGKIKTVILDGAHNPEGIKGFVTSFNKCVWAKKPFDIIFGVLKDKNYKQIAKEISKAGARTILLVPVKSTRTLNVNNLKKIFCSSKPKYQTAVCQSLNSAIKQAGDTLVITGSLYLVGEALKIMKYKGENND